MVLGAQSLQTGAAQPCENGVPSASPVPRLGRCTERLLVNHAAPHRESHDLSHSAALSKKEKSFLIF